MKACNIDGCKKPIAAKNVCSKHYKYTPSRIAYKNTPKRIKAQASYSLKRSKSKSAATARAKYISSGAHRKSVNKYQRTFRGRFTQLVRQAKRRELICTLTFEEYCILIGGIKCHYCSRGLNPLGHALDRKNNDVGYVFDNCVPCCKICNKIKSDLLSYDEMLKVAALLKELRSEKTTL